jgi:magnesium transporter
MKISLIGYDPAGAWQKDAKTVEELLEYRNTAGLTWINVDGLDDASAIRRLTEVYHIHSLTVEDILDINQRPKSEEFDTYLLIIFKSVSRNGKAAPEFEQISLILTMDTVITFQEAPGDPFNGIRRRILSNVGRFRKMGSDYLAYAIIDSLVDEYFMTVESFGTEIEEFEERALDENDTTFIIDLQRAKQSIIQMRRIIWPLRESIATVLHLDSDLINDELEPFLKDILDNIVQAAETVENYRELLSGVLDVNFSVVSNRMNRVMKVLTIISTIFIPLTFIVGVYGMNFTHMPELAEPLAYPLVWGVMVLIAIAMLIFFKRRHWL